MKRICDVCGCEADEHWMMRYNTGRTVKWFCWECWKQSQYEAAKSEMQRQKKLISIHDSKRRNK